MAVCASCRAENREGARFCDSCGAALAEAPAAREERKVVTVLFADLVGFTGRAERLDPEDVRALLMPYYGRLRSELERFGGTVEKFIGDAVMALFGAPLAHEDDPERAVRAALAIRDAMGELNEADPELGLQVRIGVSTGEALVALDARPGEGEGMAAGDVVNTAARLQAAAPVDGILVGETTYRATRGAITYREAQPVEAKGKQEPVPAWEAVEARSRFGVDVDVRGRGPQLVGRREEVEILRDALSRVRHDRAPQLVTLVGVPGIGKSRLVYELFRSVEDDPDLIYWRQGRCLPYGQGITFWAVGEMVKAQAGILETDRAEAVAANLRDVLRATFSDSSEAEWVEAHLRPLAGLGAEEELGQGRRAEAFAAWRRFFEAVADQRPLVLVFEDLHWADDGVLDFVDYLVDWATEVPLLVVCTARPELLERRPGWGGGKRNSATVSLAPLSEEETARLVAALLEQAVLPAEVQASLLAHAGGNPLYAEEYVRMLLDRGFLRRDGASLRLERSDELPLPESVQGILAARLDALSVQEKALLQDAAVVGKVFWVGTLEAIGGEKRGVIELLLHALERKEFVRRERRSSVASESEYAFRHVLVRDVAYGLLPRARRSERHRLAAEWIESLAGDRAEEKAEMLAHHYLAAFEYATAAGEGTDGVAARARVALRNAGDRAAALDGPAAAVGYYRRALDLWPHDDPGRARVLLGLGRELSRSEGTGDDELAEVTPLLLEQNDVEGAALAEVALAQNAWSRGDQVLSFEHFELAHAHVEEGPPSREKAYVLQMLASRNMTAGRFEPSTRFAREALGIYEELGDVAGRAETLNTLGVSRIGTGDLGGFEHLEECIAVARERNLPLVLGRACLNLGSLREQWGELAAVPALIDESARAWEQVGSQLMTRWLRVERGFGLYFQGRWDESLVLMDSFIEESRTSPHYMELVATGTRGLIRIARGETETGVSDALRSVELARAALDPQALYPALAGAAHCLTHAGREREAEELASEVLALWRDGDQPFLATVWIVWSALVLGEQRELREAIEAARVRTRWLEPARSIASGDFSTAAEALHEIGALGEEAYCRLRAGEVLRAAGRGAEVDAELERALAFFRGVRASAFARRCEVLLAA